MGRLRNLAIALLAAPLGAAFGSLLLTILLVPFWRWLEQTTGIESIGHSGPAEWCYWLNFGALYAGLAGLLLRGPRPSANEVPPCD